MKSLCFKNNFLFFLFFSFTFYNSFAQGTLTWATYYGGTLVDRVTAVKTDAAGNVYIAGKTESVTGIATAGAYQIANAGMADAFVAKFDASGNRLWATYFGGAANDEAFSLAVASNGFVYISGMTFSAAGVAVGGHQTVFGGLVDAFLAKFDATTGNFVWSTYMGGAAFDEAQAVETDAAGNVYITGSTQSTTSIAFNAFQNSLAGSGDIFVSKFNATGVLQWSTYYGAVLADYAYGIAVDNNAIYICGFTRSTTGFAFGGFQNAHGGGTNDAVIVKFDAATGNRIWASYYGGLIDDTSYDVQIDVNGDIYLVGITASINAISFNGHQNTFGAGVLSDAFLVKFDAAGNRIWATYYGGTNHDKGESIATDALGNVYVGASSYSPNAIAFNGYQNALVGTENFYIVKFTSAGVRICATYYGNNKELDGRIAVDANQNVYLAGTIFSTSSGLALNGFQSTNAGGQSDGFLSKFGPCTNVVNANFNSSNLSGCEGLTVNFTNTSTGANDWAWDFGDGNIDSVQNPSNTYQNSGQYTVTLIASDGTTNDTQTFVNYITIHPHAVAASAPSANIICAGQSISFTNTSSNAASYLWNFGNGNTSTNSTPTTSYLNPGNYTVTLIAINSNGCNDTLTIPVVVKPNSSFTNNQTICSGNSYTLPSGGVVSSPGTYYDTLNAANGCDSTITTNLAITPSLTFSQSISICNGNNYTLPGGTIVNTAGIYKDTVSTTAGCDSIITTTLTLVAALTTNQAPTICTGNSYALPGGNSVSTSGMYIDTLTSSGGCDSIITTVLTIASFITSSQNPIICTGNNFTLPDNSVVTIGGTYIDTLTSFGGCDSIITTILSVTAPLSISVNASICNGNSHTLPGGAVVTVGGTYYDTLATLSGCDSIVTTVLSVVNAISISQNQSICTGSNYALPGGTIVNTGGTYIDTVLSSAGCDSIVTTNLAIVNAILFSQNQSICNGSSYILSGGTSVNTSGVYVDTLVAFGGCDSIITTNLQIKPNSLFSQNIAICSGTIYSLPDGSIVNTSGVYKDTIVSSNGCDSVITTTLAVISASFASVSADVIITSGQSTTLTASGGGTYSWSPAAGLNTTTGSTVIANPSETTIYCVLITDVNGCIDSACVTVYVEIPCPDLNNLVIPNAFSPNNDGVNDEFCIQGWTPCNHEFVIYIYNRWGEKVYESKDPDFCWDGIKNGQTFDAQVFVYHIKAKFLNSDKPIIKKGNISLIR